MRWLAIIVSVFCLFPASTAFAAETEEAFTLKDGSIVRFRGITFGTNHPNPVKDDVWKWMPNAVAQLFGHTNLTRATRPVSLVLWWTHEGTNISRNAFECSLVGSNGFETFLVGELPFASSSNRLLYARFANFPLKEKTLRVRVHGRAGAGLIPLGEFTLSNPAHGLAKPWKADAPATIKRDGDFEATLLGVETGVPVTSADKMQFPGTVFRFDAAVGGKPASGWDIRAVYVTNSAGEYVNQYGLASVSNRSDSATRYERIPALWPNEPYLITARFAQNHNSIFAKEDRWTVTIPVPPPGEFSRSDASTERHGLKLRVRGIRRVGSSPPWPPADLNASGDALDVECGPCGPLDGVVVSILAIVGESGVDVGTQRTTVARNFSVPLTLGPGTNNITIHFRIHRLRTLQWIVEPKSVKPK